MFNRNPQNIRISRTKRNLFFQNSDQQHQNQRSLSKSRNYSQSRYRFEDEKYNRSQRINNRNYFEQQTKIEEDHFKSSPENTRSQQSIPLKNERQQKIKAIQSKQVLTSKQSEQIQYSILNRLSQLNFQNRYQILRQNFFLIIKQHIEIKNYQPNALTMIGANILTNGIFHQFWIKIVRKNQTLSKMAIKRIKKQYYQNFRNMIKMNIWNFQENLGGNQLSKSMIQIYEQNILQKSKISCQSKQQTIQVEKENVLPEQIQEISQNNTLQVFQNTNLQLCQTQYSITTINLTSQKQTQNISLNQSQIEGTVMQAQQNDESTALPINLSLLKFRQLNERRIAAEMVCKFLNITSQRTFSISQIKIEEILQVYQQSKFQYAIIMGRRIFHKCIKKKIKNYNQLGWQNLTRQESQYEQKYQQIPKCFISCYKYLNFEQLIRLQLTYGKFFGFIAYDNQIDFYQFLTVNQGKNRLSLTYKTDSNYMSSKSKINSMAFPSENSNISRTNGTNNDERQTNEKDTNKLHKQTGKRRIYKRKKYT